MLSVQDGVIYITHGDYAQTPPFKIIGQDDEGHETEYELKENDLLILTVRERPNHESPVLIRIESTDGIFDADGNEIGGLKIAAGDPVKIGTFLGRDLYRRVITTSSTGTVLSGFNPYDIVDIYGYVRFSNGVRYRIPFYYDSSHYSRVYVDDSNRVLFTTNGGTVSRAVIVIEYTNQ